MTTYKAKSSAIRAAKKLHGDNWAEACKIVAVADGFSVETLRIHDNNEDTRLKMVEELKAGLAKLNKPTKVVTAAMPVKGPVNATAPATDARNTKSAGGRPIDPTQAKTRRSLVTFIAAQNGNQFTVKQVRAKLKQKLQHVSNAMRWAEHNNLVARIGYKEDKRPGRRELIFKAVAVEQKNAA